MILISVVVSFVIGSSVGLAFLYGFRLGLKYQQKEVPVRENDDPGWKTYEPSDKHEKQKAFIPDKQADPLDQIL